MVGDILDRELRRKIIISIGEEFGKLDILVNNIGFNIRKSTIDFTESEILQVFQTNFLSTLELCRESFPLLKNSRQSSIVNIASVAGHIHLATGSAYGTSKAAMIQMSKNLACEWAPHGIRVNTVAPWYTETPLAKPVLENEKKLQKILSRTPMGRIAKAKEVASAVSFLAMDQSPYITGQCLSVDGGFSVNGMS